MTPTNPASTQYVACRYWTPDNPNYAALCEAHNLDATPTGWGLVLTRVGHVEITNVTADIGYVRLIEAGAGGITDDEPVTVPLDHGRFHSWIGWPTNWPEAIDDNAGNDQ